MTYIIKRQPPYYYRSFARYRCLRFIYIPYRFGLNVNALLCIYIYIYVHTRIYVRKHCLSTSCVRPKSLNHLKLGDFAVLLSVSCIIYTYSKYRCYILHIAIYYHILWRVGYIHLQRLNKKIFASMFYKNRFLYSFLFRQLRKQFSCNWNT